MENSFLHRTAKSIIDKLDWQQLSHTTLVLPSHRAGLVLKNELLQLQKAQNQKAVWAPDVKTLQQLQDALSPLYAEDELLTVVRLYKKYSALSSQHSEEIMSLDMFYGWGRVMLADFTNIDASMPAEEVPNFFDNTIAAHELSCWTLDPEVEERLKSLLRGDNAKDVQSTYVKEQYEQLWRNLHTLYDGLRAEMAAEQKGYAGMRQRAVIEQWDSDYIQSQIAGRTYVFVGFNYLLPVERELMEKLKDQALFFWDFVPDFQTNEKAFSFAKINSARLKNDNDPLPITNSQSPITVMSCVSKEAQAQYVHTWLQENYTKEGQKVGVVICDETMLESVIYTLPAINLGNKTTPEPVNITKGFPLRNTVVYARVLNWLYDRRRGDVEQVVSPDFINRLLADIFPATDQSYVSHDSSPLNWQELLILESEFQVRKLVNQLRKIVAEGLGDIPFTLKLFRLLMRRVMESVTMPFHGEPVTDMQVMGVLETRLLDFDKLLLLNVEEGVIPQKQADNSFIPYYLRKSYSMQTSDERATVYAYNFFRLLSRSGHSTLLFTTTDGGDSKGMSRFVMQILVSPEFTVEKAQLKEAGVIIPFDESRLGTSGVALKDKMRPPYFLSPSMLNTYIECPRKFCFKYIQKLHEPDKEEEVFSSATMGTFVHNAMQYIYETQLNCKSGVETPVSAHSIEQILNDEACLKNAIKEAYKKINAEWEEKHKGETEHYKQDQHRHEEPTLLAYIRTILERDKQDAEVGLKMYLLEKDRYFQVDVPQMGPVQTGGRIDRVDIYGPKGQEKLRVVDYKTGKFDSAVMSFKGTMNELMSRPEKRYIRQTLIYSHALMTTEQKNKDMPIEPNLYFCGHQLVGSKTALEINKMSDYKLMSEDLYEALSEKVEEILTVTEFPPCDEKKCKPYCPFIGLCRRKPEEHNRE